MKIYQNLGSINKLCLCALMAIVGLVLWADGVHAQTGGVPLWTNYHGNAETYDLEVDRAGNVFVTGKPSSGGFLTIKYSGTGEPLWTKPFNSPAINNARGLDVAVDGSGNAFVTGVASGSACATIKYSATGVTLWTNYLDAYATWDMAVDANGRVIVTGGTGSGAYLTAAYSNAGAPLWTNFHGPGSGPDGARAVAVGGSGNVVVTGTAGTVKYSAAGVPMWTNSAPGTAVAVDSIGNVFVTGESGVITKYSPAGAVLWTASSPTGAWLGPMALDSSGNLYVARRTFSTRSANYDITTAKYSGAGQLLWANSCNGPLNIDDHPQSLVLDRNGNVFVYGESVEELWPGDYFFRGLTIVAYRAGGTPLWTNRYESAGEGWIGSTAAGGAAVDYGGNLFIGGMASRGPNGRASVVIKYSSALAPHLAISRTASAVEVSWPSPSTGFTLQENTHADRLTNWSNVSTPVQDDGLRKKIFVEPAPGYRVYRLIKP